MRKLTLLLVAVFALAACVDSPETQRDKQPAEHKTETRAAEPTRDEIDELKLAYIKLDNGTVHCEHKVIDEKYAFAACQFIAIGSKSAPQIWYYDNQKDAHKRFYAFTGKARTTYENHLIDNPVLGDYTETFGSPIPKDIDMEKITQAFQ